MTPAIRSAMTLALALEGSPAGTSASCERVSLDDWMTPMRAGASEAVNGAREPQAGMGFAWGFR